MADNTRETSRLLDGSVGFRKQNIVRNDYKQDTQYNAGHPDALSTGDELGKEEVNGSIGGATDIKERKKELAKNSYNSNRMYDASTA